MLRSIGAIVAGFLVTSVLALTADAVMIMLVPDMMRDGRVNGPGILLIMLAYSGLSAVAGGYVSARLAPSRPMLHAMILGGIALALSILAPAMFWSAGPVWYHAAAVGLVLPSAWLGGTLAESRRTGALAGG